MKWNIIGKDVKKKDTIQPNGKKNKSPKVNDAYSFILGMHKSLFGTGRTASQNWTEWRKHKHTLFCAYLDVSCCWNTAHICLRCFSRTKAPGVPVVSCLYLRPVSFVACPSDMCQNRFQSTRALMPQTPINLLILMVSKASFKMVPIVEFSLYKTIILCMWWWGGRQSFR